MSSKCKLDATCTRYIQADAGAEHFIEDMTDISPDDGKWRTAAVLVYEESKTSSNEWLNGECHSLLTSTSRNVNETCIGIHLGPTNWR